MKTKTTLLAACRLAAGLAVPSLHSQDFTFMTIAGGAPGFLDGLNAGAQLYDPTGAAVDGAGNVYVADHDNNAIREITPLGTNWIVTTIAGGSRGSLDGTNTAAQFYGPAGIVIDSFGKLFVTDQYNSTIRQLTPAGANWVVSTIAGSAGLAGNLDGTNGNARFSVPAGISVDGSGRLFVADEANNSIRMITPSGTNWIVTTIAGGSRGDTDGTNSSAQFSSPSGVAVDAGDRVFVADQFNNTIRLVTPAGTNWVVSTIAGQSVSGRADGTGTDAQFDAPISVAVDTNDYVYVADFFNNAVRKMTLVGTNWMVRTIAGGTQGTADGAGTNAQFNYPNAVTADAFGDVFVADSQNNTVRFGTAVGSLPPAGALQVAIAPPGAVSAGAQWQLDGGSWQTNSAIMAGLVPGNHIISFTTVAGFTTPALQIIPVTARQTALAAGNYREAIANAGSLQVLISPPGAINAGAQWQVDSGAWQTNEGIVAGLAEGAHTVSFSVIPGWTAPASQAITITNSQTTLVQSTYVLQSGSLQVTILPAAAVTAGAEWQVDGGTLHAGGTTLSGQTLGAHTLGFNTVLGWATPSNQVIIITNTLTTAATATYVYFADIPQLTGMSVDNGAAQFYLSGQAGSNYVIQASSDFVTWTPLSTNLVPQSGFIPINDPGLATNARRFYRAVLH